MKKSSHVSTYSSAYRFSFVSRVLGRLSVERLLVVLFCSSLFGIWGCDQNNDPTTGNAGDPADETSSDVKDTNSSGDDETTGDSVSDSRLAAPEESTGAGDSHATSGSAGTKGSAMSASAGGTTATMASASASKGEAAPSSSASADTAGVRSASPAVSSDRTGDGNNNANIEPGTLTAGAWDDNRNFERFSQYRSSLLQKNLAGAIPTSDTDHARAHETYSSQSGSRTKLDVALVIDTTGSMGDEIAYLQAEFLAISQAIESTYPNSEQRWALVVYRDEGDIYVVRSFPFESSATTFRERLNEQRGDGGGDFPEADHAALAEMNRLEWRAGDDVARLAFWVGDAPHHNENAKPMAEAVLAAQGLKIHIYPIASSGIDELTELTMRSAAQLTGGRYLFLTNDSGVGGEHKEPTIPCYFVTKLNDAILRMVDIEMTGVYREPSENAIIRKAGDPQDGACTLESGEKATIF